MGKLIEEKYPNVSHRIIKKSSKKDKASSIDKLPVKRKLPSIEDDDQPRAKTTKPDYELEVVVPHFTTSQKGNETIPCKIYAVQCNDDVRLEIKENKVRDLFLHDELSNSYENYTNNDLGFQIIDEISLEGLDGITIEAFWKRLAVGLQKPIYINDSVKKLIWKFICKKKGVQFYKLPKPRDLLDIYDRSKYLDTDIGVVVEVAYELPDIYPHELVNHPEVQGSCSTFETRLEISKEVVNLDLKDAEQRYGTSLVIVADQNLRNKALFYESADPTAELANMEYCILERIGRARRHGELTQGNMSIGSHFKMDPKSVYHYKKQLVHYNLLAKQFFYIKSAVVDQNKTGKLLQLKRFYHKIKSKQMLVAEQIVNAIKESPECRIEFDELRRIFQGFTQPVAKIIRSPDFRKYIKTEMVCYRDIYPNATKAEYMRKSKPIEKFIRCIELVDPCVNVTASWNAEQEDSDDDNEDVEDEIVGGKIYNMECFKEVYYHVLTRGRNGCSALDLQKLVGVDSNTIRMCLKKLVTIKALTVKRVDRGKQRYHLYFADCSDSEDVKPNLSPTPPKLSNNVLARFRERQRAARQKPGCAPTGRDSPPSKSFGIKRGEYKRDVPQLTCLFLVKNLPKIVCDTTDDSIGTILSRLERNYTIRLSVEFPRTVRVSYVNEALKQIVPGLVTRRFEAKFDPSKAYDSKNDTDYVTKLILLKAALGEAKINASTLNCFSNKRQRSDVPLLSDMDKDKSKSGNDKLQFMGPEPVTVFNDIDDNVQVEIIVSTPPTEFKNTVLYSTSEELSERVLSRIAIILRVVHDKKIFEDVYKLVKVIEEDELKEGYANKIDRKSVARILKRLVTEGYVKIFKLVIVDDRQTKTQTFVCHPSVNHSDSLIQSVCQQLKWKYFVGTYKKSTKANVPALQKNLEEKIKNTASPFRSTDVMSSVRQLKELSRLRRGDVALKPNRQAGRSYGFKPKFVRMRILHEFLYYLIYEYARDTKPLNGKQVEKLFGDYRIRVTTEDLKQIPAVYCEEIGWKTFIPPLPDHGDWTTGWALMCDVILRLPISVLCKIHNIGYDCAELVEVLNHPIKRFYLVKDLPDSVRVAVFLRRKYLFRINETMCRLAWCGLAQFGPQKYKEKDQVFVYLNRRASLYDTTTSEPGYNKVADKEYRKLGFFFNSQADIDSYWYNAYGICLSTKLNLKQEGQVITVFDPQSRPELTNAQKSKTPEQAVEDDNGEIPGDRRGAAGFDSSLWSHLMKNWFWANHKRSGEKPSPSTGLRKEKLEKILPKNLPFNELHTTAQTNKVYLHKTPKETKGKLRKYVHVPLRPSKTTQKIVRRVPYRPKPRKRQYHDNLDRAILRHVGIAARIKWSETEDRALLLCLAACAFLNPKLQRKQAVSYIVMRDVLHRICPESRYKTSRAVQRRAKTHLVRKHRYAEDNAGNLLELGPISENFSMLIDDLTKKNHGENSVKYTDAQMSAAFVVLMSYLARHREEVENVLQGNLTTVDHLSDERLNLTENDLAPSEETTVKYTDVKNEEDVRRDTLKSVMLSSLGCKNQPGWTFQLFKIYQRYPDGLICEALSELKRSQAVSFDKLVPKKKKNRWHTPFHLSNLYIYAQSATFNVATALEAYNTFLNLKRGEKCLDFSLETVEAKKYGRLLGVNEFGSFWETIRYGFHIPRSTVILNPHITDHEELVEVLACRFQARLKRIFQDGTESELEPDADTENRTRSQDLETVSSLKEEPDDPKDAYGLNDNPLDLTADTETIDRLKTWVTDCLEAEKERRSPSPEFKDAEESDKTVPTSGEAETERMESYDETDKIRTRNLKRIFNKEQIPTLEEIKEGMLKYTPPNEERTIPYITDLSVLLNRDINEPYADEEQLERLKKHFITQYAVLDELVVENLESLPHYFLVEYVESKLRNGELWRRISSNLIVGRPDEMCEVYDRLGRYGGGKLEFDLTDEIIAFVADKKCVGATGPVLKGRFKRNYAVSLEVILRTLVAARIFIRTGVCTLTFVHYSYRSPWLVESFALSSDEQRFLEEKASAKSNVRENIEKQLDQKSVISVHVMPWIKVDGTLNEESFKKWLCNVLSHCLDCPKVTFERLCEKFCYLKPVDIYYLVEVLRELGCVDVVTYEESPQDVFSNWERIEERDATFLDGFENMYITPNNVSMTCLGSFYHEINVV